VWNRVRYRVGQFVRGWQAHVSPADLSLARQVLSPAALALFDRMPMDAQAHSLRVLKLLLADGDTPSDLAVAALLHDVGKVAATEAGAYLGLWLRGPLVLLDAIRPDWVRRWASATPSASIRYALYVHREHPRIGATWSRLAGCTALACWLIEHHQDKLPRGAVIAAGAQTLLARLQWADGRN
jgi:hypothetical protein